MLIINANFSFLATFYTQLDKLYLFYLKMAFTSIYGGIIMTHTNLSNIMTHTILFTLIKSQPAYYADGYELYFTSDTTDTDIANHEFGIGTKYLSYNHPDRFFANAYHIETYVADGGVYIKIGIPYLD